MLIMKEVGGGGESGGEGDEDDNDDGAVLTILNMRGSLFTVSSNF